MRSTLFLVFCLTVFAAAAKAQTAWLPIIPAPNTISLQPDAAFVLPQTLTWSGPAEATEAVNLLNRRLSPSTGIVLSKGGTTAGLVFQLTPVFADSLGKAEGYRLQVSKEGIRIQAGTAAGFFYAAQSLLQALPPEVLSTTRAGRTVWTVPGMQVEDKPRFGWRGLMLDVARHFFTVDDVKRFIDNMAMYKYNRLHWHLTDDEGWRIEIKSLPKLTQVGAWSRKREGYFGTFAQPPADEPATYGGFYTQDQIREVVAYAKSRFIEIMPEVDVPGHSLAAVASYPELSCTPGASAYKVRSGEKIMEWPAGGGFYALIDNTLCPANEKVYTFLDKVYGEVAALFPFGYIHVGGDEAAPTFWKKSPQVAALMKREGLKDYHAVQGYFERRVQKIVASKGKKMMGWDEILEGGLAPGAAVMSWRGMKGGIEAARLGSPVVMSPTTHAYLDYMQADVSMEPRVYSSLRLSKSYEFDPLPDSVNPKYILGGQGNLWAEQIYHTRHLEYMLWPRALAISEAVWSAKPADGKRDWPNFLQRVEQHFQRLDSAEINYSTAVWDPMFKIRRNAAGVEVELATEAPGLDIYYSWDNTFPDRFGRKYSAPIAPPNGATMLRVVTCRGKQKMGRMHTLLVEDLEKRAGKK